MAHRIEPNDMKLARGVARRYGPVTDSDIESAAMKGLLKAAHTYDGRGTWKGYAHQCCVWAINDLMESRKKRLEEPMAHEDLTTVADEVAYVEIDVLPDTTELHNALRRLPGPVVQRLLDGRIDRRRAEDQRALETLRQALA